MIFTKQYDEDGTPHVLLDLEGADAPDRVTEFSGELLSMADPSYLTVTDDERIIIHVLNAQLTYQVKTHYADGAVHARLLEWVSIPG